MRRALKIINEKHVWDDADAHGSMSDVDNDGAIWSETERPRPRWQHKVGMDFPRLERFQDKSRGFLAIES